MHMDRALTGGRLRPTCQQPAALYGIAERAPVAELEHHPHLLQGSAVLTDIHLLQAQPVIQAGRRRKVGKAATHKTSTAYG